MDSRNWLSDHIHRVSIAKDQAELELALENTAKALGFEHFAFGLRKSFPIAEPETEMINNYPVEWQVKYAQNGYLLSDPTVHHGLTSILPIVWTEELFHTSRPMWEDARSFGLNHGWAQACRDASGNIGMLSLARAEENLSEKELIYLNPNLAWLSQLTHVGFSKFMLEQNELEELTGREREILRWTAEGKTSWEISVILAVSQRTVNFHVNNCVAKLQVTNKTAAVVKALLKGLI